jgi:hypothetical protein
MAATKVTTGYAVEARTVGAERIFAVMREYMFRGNAGSQLVTIYRDEAVADSIAATLNHHKNKEH